MQQPIISLQAAPCPAPTRRARKRARRRKAGCCGRGFAVEQPIGSAGAWRAPCRFRSPFPSQFCARRRSGSVRMEPAEAEFLAEKELVTIVPSFSMDRVHLIGGDLGPFNPGLPVEVPVWLAINLKQRQKCRLIPPEWMDVEKLEEIRDQERKEDTFTPMPSPYYMELTKLLLNYASDNIPKADEIRTLVKDTWDTRMAKLRLSADSFVRQQEAHAKLDNLTLMEINTIGTFLTQALDHMYKLRTNLQPSGSTESQDF
ncbi:DNA replication complex GINS protein PSF2 [Tympanuchus pallidicinctus]|uniref:DNA replication complex GINS protein PSF2 n=1 Tax=Tympanuchus pallidicinctus TaxID=109042 RepID=UPI0022870E60|nr:DNA replication complex GINS protein PSF2 [Tympanuchus pallidicinctus]